LAIISKLKEEFSFIRGNYAVLVLSWIIMDFAMELPGTYYSLYVVDPALGGTETILGIIGFVSFLALALVQFPGGYLADKHGRRWLISTMTFGVALSYIFYALAPSWHSILVGAMVGNLCLIYQPALLAMTADSLPPCCNDSCSCTGCFYGDCVRVCPWYEDMLFYRGGSLLDRSYFEVTIAGNRG